jgi:ubiquinone biosynthesis protein
MKSIDWIVASWSMAVRSQRISYVLSRYGIAGSLGRIGIELGKRGVSSVTQNSVQSTPLNAVFGKNLASTCAELGPTFIKLGQLLAQRPDWVGETVAFELRVLFDRVPPIAYRKVEKILKQEWGKKKFQTAIKKINKQPLASASLSQTHLATLKDGRDVILKVQKPGVDKNIRIDLKLMESAVVVLDALHPKLNLKHAFKDFKEATLREIDYREEAKNIDRFQRNNKGVFSQSSVIFPAYEKELLTSKVIVLEPMRGKKAAEIKKDSRAGRRAAHLSASAVLEQIFEQGFFHADPHAGNLFFQEDTGKIAFIDLGLVGQLEDMDRKKFTRVMLAILKRDKSELTRSLFELGVPGKTTVYEDFERGIGEILERIKVDGVKNLKINKVVDELFQLAHQNQLFIPNRYVLMIRSCLMVEGLAKQLDSKISLFGIAAPILTKSLIKSYNPLSRFRSNLKN